MDISPLIPLVSGLVAAGLFVAFFVAASIITFRNRKLIRKEIVKAAKSHNGSEQ